MASITSDDAPILTHRTNQAPDEIFGKDRLNFTMPSLSGRDVTHRHG